MSSHFNEETHQQARRRPSQHLSTMDQTSAAGSHTRPALIRSATTRSIATPSNSADEGTPLLSRPLVNRSTSAATVLQNANRQTHPSTPAARPSLLRRATDFVASAIDISNDYYTGNPSAPSHWIDHTHRKPLLQLWDAVSSAAAASKYRASITSQLLSTEKRMLERYPELGEGEVQLTTDWIEHVLGVCMRHPFCTSSKMGRWHVLASSGGARGNWGPF